MDYEKRIGESTLDNSSKNKYFDSQALNDPNISNGVILRPTATREDIERQKTIEGDAYFSRLGWKRLSVVCIVQCIALGSLGLPAAFASLGMVPGIILCIGMGIASMYASYILGKVKLKHRHVMHYVDIGTLMMGKFGTVFVAFLFVALGTLTIGSHCLTGKIALVTISGSDLCSILFGVVSAVILMLLAIPPSFTEIAILGYIDFASILLAIGITIVATGIQHSRGDLDGGVPWSAWPKNDLSFAEGFIALNNILFAFGFAMSQPSFMAEMHTPEDYTKSIYTLGLVATIVYTLTGALIYYFVGQEVQSPALLSAGSTVSKVAFGVALPVIFISGSINTTAICRYMHGQLFKNSIIRYINTTKGWATWLGLVSIFTLLAWIVAESIPFFSELLSICACLFISGLNLYLPGLSWFLVLQEGKWYERKNIVHAVFNCFIIVLGIVVLICGMYASVNQLIVKFRQGDVGMPFSCSA